MPRARRTTPCIKVRVQAAMSPPLAARDASCGRCLNRRLLQAVRYPCTTVCIYPRGSVFQARLLNNQKGANTERHVFGKLSARCFKPPLFWHRYYSNCEDIEHGKSAQGCVIYAVVYGVSNVKCRFSIYSAQSNYRCVGEDFGNPK